MNTMFLIYIAMMAVGIAVLAALFMRDVKKNRPCDNCAKLVSKVGREYRCYSSHGCSSYFKKAPSYCAHFEPKGGVDT